MVIIESIVRGPEGNPSQTRLVYFILLILMTEVA